MSHPLTQFLNLGVNSPVLVFRKQEINIHEQLELARYFGPLHKHPTTYLPKEPGLEEVHGKIIKGIHFTITIHISNYSCLS